MPISSWRATEKLAQNGLKRCASERPDGAVFLMSRRCATPTLPRARGRRGSSAGRRYRPEARRARGSRTPARRPATGRWRRWPASRTAARPSARRSRCGQASGAASAAPGRRARRRAAFVSSMAGDYRGAMEKPKRKMPRQRQRSATASNAKRAAAPGAALVRSTRRPRCTRYSAASPSSGRSRRASSSMSTPSRCWSPWCCRRRRPTPASTRRRARCSRSPTRREKMLALGEEKVGDYIRTIGLWRNKAKNVIALSQALIRDHGGEVPGDRDELVTSCRASGARPPMSCSTWPSASRPWRSTRIFSGSATGWGWRPARRRSRSRRG